MKSQHSKINNALQPGEEVVAETQTHPVAYLLAAPPFLLAGYWLIYKAMIVGIGRHEHHLLFIFFPLAIVAEMMARRIANVLGIGSALALTNRRILSLAHASSAVWFSRNRVTSSELSKVSALSIEQSGLTGALGIEGLLLEVSGSQPVRLPCLSNAREVVNAASEAATETTRQAL